MGFLEHFGFIEQPFGVTPDPRFLHLGTTHREALASLLCATEENRGFVALIAPPGMGKTTLLFQYLEGLRYKARTAFLFQHARDAGELMRYALIDLGVSPGSQDLPEMNQTLNEMLRCEMQAGRRLVLVIDEAQNLNPKVLESVRLLSNFETPWAKLIHIVLAGQPQLAETLSGPSMAQLRQRISAFARLKPFSARETNEYIDHRLWVAGRTAGDLFTVGSRNLIAEQSEGIPRNINNLCYQSLTLAHASGAAQVKAEMVREVISDLAVESLVPRARSRRDSQQVVSIGPFGPSGATGLPAGGLRAAGPLRSPSGAGGKTSRAVVAISALLFASIVSGVLWKAHVTPRPLGVTPNVEAAAFPARVMAPAPAPETIPPVAVSPLDAQTPAEPGAAPADGASAEATTDGPFVTVEVKPGMTLRHISLEYLGRFGPADLAEILSLNPRIKSANQIEAGELIRLPRGWRPNSDEAVPPDGRGR